MAHPSLEEQALLAYHARETRRQQEKEQLAIQISHGVRERIRNMLDNILGAHWEDAYSVQWEGDRAKIDDTYFTLGDEFQKRMDVDRGALVATVTGASGNPIAREIKNLAELGEIYSEAARS